jgi:pimeloyl-ACP methyl ester carboxylesterase
MKTVLALILLLAGLILIMIRAQQRMIYYPRPYPAGLNLPARLVPVEYRTSQGRQTGFYLPPAAPVPAGRGTTWLLFGGNGSLALDWLDLLENYPDPQTGFLLLDYPGYGRCQGRPSPGAILESAEGALAALTASTGIPAARLQENLGLLGHSLGAAAALLYASRHPVKTILLIAPFTSLKDMAVRVVGPLLSHTLRHDYDNRARLREILARQPAVPITIIHGNHDQVVPVAMGRELAALDPRINYLEIDRGDHNFLLITAAAEIRRAMLAAEPTGIRRP